MLLGAHTELNGPKGGYLDRVELTAAEASLRALLGDEAFEVAYAEGVRLSLPQTSSLLDNLLA
ncbi:hypothetical protein ACFQ0M_16285 [Kitasatospora aburaviensis]